MPITGPPLRKPADLTNLLTLALARKPDETALISGNRRWSWQGLQSEIDALAPGFMGMGLIKGDRIASLSPNRGELLVFCLAYLKAGQIATPLNDRDTPSEIDYALESAARVSCARAPNETRRSMQIL